MIVIRDWNRFLCGLIFLAVAALHYWEGYRLKVGTLFQMGPGMFPLMLESALALLGLISIIAGLRVVGEPVAAIGWRGLVAVVGAVLAFGLITPRLGVVPGLAAAVVLAAVATPMSKPLPTMLLAAVLIFFCVAVFVWGIGIPVRLFALGYAG